MKASKWGLTICLAVSALALAACGSSSGDTSTDGNSDLFTTAGLTASKGAARRLLEQGGMYVNGRRLSSADRAVGADALLHGRYLLLRKGARDYALVGVNR